MALDAGRAPILVPRERQHGEHVDDHQRQIAEELDRRGLAIHASAESLSMEDLDRAAAIRVSKLAHPAPIRIPLQRHR
jgi:UDP-N-acetylglucosamine--N-acetylmuramyl-(pentapeptide) pyrophosphoryl-undecaprenol N-acetylglucosamine transferase